MSDHPNLSAAERFSAAVAAARIVYDRQHQAGDKRFTRHDACTHTPEKETTR